MSGSHASGSLIAIPLCDCTDFFTVAVFTQSNLKNAVLFPRDKKRAQALNSFMHSEGLESPKPIAAMLILALALIGTLRMQAQPSLNSTTPPDGASGVSTTTTIVFTFSEAMDTNVTAASFLDISPFSFFDTTPSWNAGHTILTCTPISPFPPNKTIYWTLDGESATGDPLDDSYFGSFTTGGSGGSGGSGTNAITTFSVGKVHHYQQTSSGAPTLDPFSPYGFAGATALSSNRTATSVTLTLPTGSVSNLTHLPPPSAEIFLMSPFTTSLSSYDAIFPSGDYSFFVQATSSNQTVVVNLPTIGNQPQPGAPHVTNYVAAQTVNPNQPFVLGWDAFAGGTSADYIDVDIGTVFNSPEPGFPGALSGTARTFTISAGTLLPNTTYASQVGFFHFVGETNASYAKAAFRATYTEFSLITTGSASLILTNAAFAAGSFAFDILCSTGQTVTVEYKTNLTSGLWQTLLTTNSPVNRFHIIAPQASTNRLLFFRARNGS
jgi:hypothetical protein